MNMPFWSMLRLKSPTDDKHVHSSQDDILLPLKPRPKSNPNCEDILKDGI